ncbi:glycosyltransferase family 2 protein [Paraburkholderia sp. GAS348]|uniref:glycosyltransferase family 2 protein n=1 Tax=Paraburkholderia sp. GAS348 TaxID=3035132 RepID=UPI003D21E3CB
MSGVSVLILTKDEEKDLPGCLSSVAWCDDVHLVDSLSGDRTVQIAENFGGTVTARKFDNWASDQNWGPANIPFKNEWVLYIDADERVTPELARAVRNVTARAPNEVAFKIRRRDFVGGRWLRHVKVSPFYVRLFKPAHIRYDRVVNPVAIVDGQVGRLAGFLNHYPFSKGISHPISKYSKLNVKMMHRYVESRLWSGEG